MNIKKWIMKRYMELAGKIGVILAKVVMGSFMAIILCLIVGQMVSRWTGTVFPGGTEFAGYAMACTSFFALAYTLNHGAHIRVSIFLNMNGGLMGNAIERMGIQQLFIMTERKSIG